MSSKLAPLLSAEPNTASNGNRGSSHDVMNRAAQPAQLASFYLIREGLRERGGASPQRRTTGANGSGVWPETSKAETPPHLKSGVLKEAKWLNPGVRVPSLAGLLA